MCCAVGMDFKIRCQGCGREIMLPRVKIEKEHQKGAAGRRRGAPVTRAQFFLAHGKKGPLCLKNCMTSSGRHEELAHRMSAPDAAQDPAAYAALMREYKQLEPLVETYREYVRACGEMAELEEAGRQSGLDDEFKAMLQQEAVRKRTK